MMFVILQKYDFSSKSQPTWTRAKDWRRCLWYCKSTIFQANHNNIKHIWQFKPMFVILQKYDFSSKSQQQAGYNPYLYDVCDTAKVRFFKQITTERKYALNTNQMFVILQKYDFSSKSQHIKKIILWWIDVCDTAKVRFFKQITTNFIKRLRFHLMFVILQKYDFSSKSQLIFTCPILTTRCLWYCKSTIFQANHNNDKNKSKKRKMFVILQKYDFSSKSQLPRQCQPRAYRCLWYCKSTIFQANHNVWSLALCTSLDVCDTAKVRFFKQITTQDSSLIQVGQMFVILQKYDFSSKSQQIYHYTVLRHRCLWYCKSTIFQANHNHSLVVLFAMKDVCDTAKVRFFKQITTPSR